MPTEADGCGQDLQVFRAQLGPRLDRAHCTVALGSAVLNGSSVPARRVLLSRSSAWLLAGAQSIGGLGCQEAQSPTFRPP